MKKKIIIASGSSGEGHIQATINIKDSLLKLSNEYEYKIINLFEYLPPIIRFILENMWEISSKYTKTIYRYIHKIIVNRNVISNLLKKYVVLFMKKVTPELENGNILAFVATHPLAAAFGASIKRKYGFILCIAPTDFYLHNFYYSAEVDYYYVPPNIEILKSIKFSNLDKDKLIDTGIPISNNFCEKNKKKIFLDKSILLPEIFTIFISFGGLGMYNVKQLRLINKLIKSSSSMQIIIITGRNKSLYKKIKNLCSNYTANHRIKVFGFVDNIADLMTTSDVFIGKAGGLSLSEAFARELPVAIIEILPGQEEFNVRYILRNRLGDLINTDKELIKWINLRKSGKQIASKIPHYGKCRRPCSSRTIAEHLLGLELVKKRDVLQHSSGNMVSELGLDPHQKPA